MRNLPTDSGGFGVSDPTTAMIGLASNEQVQAIAVRALGLDADTLDLDAPEAIAALLRRAASFAAPCSPRVLREHVMRAVRGLVIPAELTSDATKDAWGHARETIDAAIESLVAYGDILELPMEDGSSGRLLYLAPPTFVTVSSRTMFLLGGRPDAVESLPAELRSRVEYISHTRRLILDPAEALPDRLRTFGFVDLPNEMWLSPPRRGSAADAVDRADRALAAKSTHGEVAGLSILDTTKAPTYYRGRWCDRRGLTGRFVGRREQQWGADLWVYVDLRDGQVIHLIDLPFDSRSSDARGCDEAWQLQLAIDAVADNPQRFYLRPRPPGDSVIVDFFSPLPRWARRKFDSLGEEVGRSRSLMAYRFERPVYDAVLSCLTEDLWLREKQ